MTETTTETVPAATDNERMAVHIVCSTCYPAPVIGDPAVCGEKVLGVKPRPPYERCKACQDGRAAHVFKAHR